MASAANSLWLSLRRCARPAPFRAATVAATAPARLHFPRALSTTRPRRAGTEQAVGNESAKSDNDEEEGLEKQYSNAGQVLRDLRNDSTLTSEEKAEVETALSTWGNLPAEQQKNLERLLMEVRNGLGPLRRPVKPKKNSFWHEDEEDSDMITSEVGEDDFEEDDILGMAHGKLEELREYREYARLAVWELPLLAKFAKPFEPPAKNEPLRFRYTTYMGEFHPAERKVVVEFCPRDLNLTDAQQLKLKKLAGARYNPGKDIVHMSSDMFDNQAQNKRYLGDLVQKLMAEAKDSTDMFENIPLDTRHHVVETKPKFPKEWRLTEERRKELEAQRRQSFLLDEAKRSENKLINGVETIEKALEDVTLQEKVAELVATRVPPRGRLSGPGRR
ncbi:mitochondrial ribosomal protein [Thozetella sp. PMI_491]|nr:mitochondrial ribosomal protein [Thozetella sp. PMI_491]